MAASTHDIDLAQLAAFLNRKADGIAHLDFTAPLKVCAVLIKADVKDNFQGSHTPDGTPWPPLKRPRRGKRHKGSTPKPLLDTGLLQASISASGADHIEEVTSDALVVGSSLHYAMYQDQGTRTIPSRQFAGFSDHVIDQIEDVLLDYLEKNLL